MSRAHIGVHVIELGVPLNGSYTVKAALLRNGSSLDPVFI